MTAIGDRLDHVDWLTKGALPRLLAVLDSQGEEARVVGGAVRNALLGEPVGDVDVATTAPPDEVTRRAGEAGFKVVPTGIEHGTVLVIVHGQPFEVTTLREDIETYGRKAKVAFGRDWKRDAERRDFTMNALSLSPDGTLHDYVGGLVDLQARRVRFIGDAAARIAEDYLRILRFFRFHAAYGQGAPDPEGLVACIAARAGLETLSRERVRMELLKLMLAPHAVPALAVMAEAGLLVTTLGGVPLLASLGNMNKVEAATGIAPDAVRRLGALNVLVVEDAERLMSRLRLANSEYERLASMGEKWWRIVVDMPAQDARALLYRLRAERYVDRVLLAWSRAPQGAADECWRALATLPQRFTPPVFPLAAEHFMQRGVPKGPGLGLALRAAEEAWIAADFPAGKAELATIADGAITSVKLNGNSPN